MEVITVITPLGARQVTRPVSPLHTTLHCVLRITLCLSTQPLTEERWQEKEGYRPTVLLP